MRQENDPDPVSKKRVVYTVAGMDEVEVRRDLRYRSDEQGDLTMDVYLPAENRAPLPAVLLVAGFPDPGFEKVVGCRFKDMGSTESWARLLAASGMAAIAYANRHPETDAQAVIDSIRNEGTSLGIDRDRLALWASSGNVPLALSLLMKEDRSFVKCAVLCYGYTLDLEGGTAVAEASRSWGFVNPAAGRSVHDMPRETAFFLARAGGDAFPGLNEALDRFVAAALRHNLPLSLVNHASGPHAFDLYEDSKVSREIIRGIVDFLRFQLRAKRE